MTDVLRVELKHRLFTMEAKVGRWILSQFLWTGHQRTFMIDGWNSPFMLKHCQTVLTRWDMNPNHRCTKMIPSLEGSSAGDGRVLNLRKAQFIESTA